MAEDQDESQKTEEPTPKKLMDARKKGEVAMSQEVKHWFILLATLLIIMVFSPGAMRDLTVAMKDQLEFAHDVPVDLRGIGNVLRDTLADVFLVLLIPMVLLIAAAVAGSWSQTGGPLMTPESLKPKLDKISPIAGFKRLFSMRSFVEFLKSVFKLGIVGGTALLVMMPMFSGIEHLAGLEMGLVLEETRVMAIRLMIGILAIMSIIAGLDLMYQRYEFTKKMRMSRQELKDEYKQTEGDPQVKGRLRQLRMERSRKRMMAAVPDADVVVTNPTHYAVAMAYDPAKDAAPTVVAKGVDAIAQRIREVAEENDVPVIENPPVARALYAAVDIDQQVPPDHYKAVAEIISYVFKLKNKSMPG